MQQWPWKLQRGFHLGHKGKSGVWGLLGSCLGFAGIKGQTGHCWGGNWDSACCAPFQLLVGLTFIQKCCKTAFEGDIEVVDMFPELGMEAVGVEMLLEIEGSPGFKECHGSLALLPN